jgi:hypothetical protein
MQATQWYVAVEDRTVGPVTTDLLLAGLAHGRVPSSARICPVGGDQWLDLAHVPPFDETVGHQASGMRARMPSEGLQIEVDLDEMFGPEQPPSFDWQEPFVEFSHMNGSVALPDEKLLTDSLGAAHDTVLIQKDAMWNLALCIAFGSDQVAEVAGRTFFRVYGLHSNTDRLEWMVRVLLGRGFLPSGIPAEAGRRGLSVLQTCCPSHLLGPFARAMRGPAA